jgi:hypothetical protein
MIVGKKDRSTIKGKRRITLFAITFETIQVLK